MEHFTHHNIHAVQLIGTFKKVTFAVEASKQQVVSHQSINFNGVQCAVSEGGPPAQNVLVYNYPAEGDQQSVHRKLGLYGTVEGVAFCHWLHLRDVSDGGWVARMVGREAIPCHLSIGEFQVKISYAGQQQVCDICDISPPWGKCFQSGVEGHLSRNCPQRAGYRAGMMLGSLTPPWLPWWPLRSSRTYVITVKFPLTDIAWILHLGIPSLRSANKSLSAKHRHPLRRQPIPESRGPPISFPVCLRASSLPRKSRVALLNFHEGPFSCTRGPVVNFNQR